LENKEISGSDATNVNKVISYLESLGNADIKPKSLEVSEEEKKKYLGEYRFGAGEGEIFVVDLHRLGFLQIGGKVHLPVQLRKVEENTFSPAGAPSVKIIFKITNDKALSLSVHEPEPTVIAARV
jgi:hypothetical protein